MGEVEDVEVSTANRGKSCDEDEEHDERRRNACEDQGHSPNAKA